MTKKLPIIEISGITKIYDISHKLKRNQHPTIKESLTHIAKKPLELIGSSKGVEKESFKALDGVSFEVFPGEVVGIMGRNGSGKSTLFKILSRITQPSSGSIKMRGSVASLLEVGTGFHPELTGRENIYFNGSILGMSRKEIDEKFDKIVEFSEVEKFLDTPIKFYSSGMKVRLAFSVAAHLEPEILIIDEVLAVGDVKFKQKSIQRMKDIAASGTTVLFVSHIIGQIRQICTRGVVLHNGELVYDGELGSSIDKYLELNQLDKPLDDEEDGTEVSERDSVKKPDVEVVTTTELRQPDHKTPSIIINVSIHSKTIIKEPWVCVLISDLRNKNIVMLSTSQQEFTPKDISTNEKRILSFTANDVNLAPGTYNVSVIVSDRLLKEKEPLYREDRVNSFSVKDYKIGKVEYSLGERKMHPPMVIPNVIVSEK